MEAVLCNYPRGGQVMGDEKHECVYGVGPDYDGSLKWYHKESTFINPMKDTIFDYCPFCGRKLEDEEDG